MLKNRLEYDILAFLKRRNTWFPYPNKEQLASCEHLLSECYIHYDEKKNVYRITPQGLNALKTTNPKGLEIIEVGEERETGQQLAEIKPKSVKKTLEDWEAALELGDAILDVLDDLPEAAEDFCEGVEKRTRSIMKWVEDKEAVTDKQMTALENMLHGAHKWLR